MKYDKKNAILSNWSSELRKREKIRLLIIIIKKKLIITYVENLFNFIIFIQDIWMFDEKVLYPTQFPVD
jgi:hypothetical protein